VAVAVYFEKNPILFSIIFAIAGVLLLEPISRSRRFPPDAATGIGLAGAWALAILFLAKAPHGDVELLELMQGNILGVTNRDIYLLLLVLLPLEALYILFFKETLFASFDGETAGAMGIRARFI